MATFSTHEVRRLRDQQAIQECLAEAELVEDLGFDAIWLQNTTSRVSASMATPGVRRALAVKTKRVDIGFGILELPCTTGAGGHPDRPAG